MEKEQFIFLRNKIIDEIFFALGLRRRGTMRKIFGPLFARAAGPFIEIISHIEDEVPRSGLNGAAIRILPDFSLTVDSHGTSLFPKQGPLLIASNHIGAFDSVAILSCISRRDLKLFASDVPFLRALTNTGKELIYVPLDATGRMAALRAGIEHLKNGGALLSFAHYEVEPDPAFMPGASESIRDWSPSIEIMMRKVPMTRLQTCIISNVLLPKYVNNPITRIRRKAFERQKLGEFMQLLSQMVSPHRFNYQVHVSFDEPADLESLGEQNIMPAVIQKAQRLLNDHLKIYTQQIKSSIIN